MPTIRQDGLRGGVMYHDGQFDDTRLLIHLMMTAAEHGATLLNYAGVVELTKDEDGFVKGVIAVDGESGERYTIAARSVVNATGIFTDETRRLAEPTVEPMMVPSQGIHLVFERSFLTGDTALLVPHTDDGRVLFAVPWHNRALVGTTDTLRFTRSRMNPLPFEEEIEFVLETAGRYLSRKPTREDILSLCGNSSAGEGRRCGRWQDLGDLARLHNPYRSRRPGDDCWRKVDNLSPYGRGLRGSRDHTRADWKRDRA